uniref:Zinc finger MYM-type protein 1-like n=1 Tax=Geotrypetes seraphini TaxID=260995 RepID=A0A6P8PJC8_GEOSA|nr:zinc finger MYM-type protein 1-like [Geotrypetes seraphini]
MKRHRPSGAQQRKIKKAKGEAIESISGSMLKYVMLSASHKGNEEDSEEVQAGTTKIPVIETQDSDDPELKEDSESSSISTDTEEENLIDSKSQHQQHKNNSGEERDASKDQEFEEIAHEILLYCDIAAWPVPVPDDLRVNLVKKGSEPFQNKNGPFSASQREGKKSKGFSRHLTTSWFYKSLPKGEKVLRTWMVYSKSKNCLFCFCCRLFADSETKAGTSVFVTGFKNWWKLNPKVPEHEQSEQHLFCLEQWKTLARGLELHKTIDRIHEVEMDKERKYWRDILHRVLDVIMFLAKQNLPFRGHREDMLSTNKGNFLELIELLSNYDPILKEHFVKIKHAIPSESRLSSYLSPKIQNEFIHLLGNYVKEKIVADIKKAKYFGILFDSTPDVSHTDQMCEVIRYVYIEDDNVEIKESFLGFFPISGKSAAELTEQILKQLDSDGLDINLCRDQGYDNAATMAGIHGGVQAKIKEINPKALFVPCANHCLNLCGVHSFGSVSSCVTFFGALEKVYSFFSVSTHRWEMLQNVGITVKRLSQTRWSAHYKAVHAIKTNFEKLMSTLEALCDSKENVDTRGSAQILLSAVCDFSFLCYLFFWCEVLHEVYQTQKYLQTAGISLEQCIVKLQALKLFLEDQRTEIVEKAINYGTTKCKDMDIGIEKRIKFRRRMPGETTKDAGLTLTEETTRAMFECLDRFHQELETRSKAMDQIMSMFAIIQPFSLIFAEEENLRKILPNITEIYDEFSGEDIILEIFRLRRHLKAAGMNPKETKAWTVLQFLEFIVKWDFYESVPNLSLCLRLFLTICVSVASCERNFSKLKLIKSVLRSTMSNDRLTNLAILSIEYEYAKKINFDEIIDKFAEAKTRKQKL